MPETEPADRRRAVRIALRLGVVMLARGAQAQEVEDAVREKAGLPIEGSLVLTGSLLRFLPGAQLVSGMHDLIAGAYMAGIARLAEVLLLGAAIAGASSLILTFGENLDVQLRITATGGVDWAAVVIVAAGAVAVAFNACRLGGPPRKLVSVVTIGALAVVIGQGFTPLFDDLSRNARTLLASLPVGALGTFLAHRL